MIRRISLLIFLTQGCGDTTPTRTLIRFFASPDLNVPSGALLHVVGYGDGARQHEEGEDLGMYNFTPGVTLPIEAEEDDGQRRFTLFAELLSATGTRLSWARVRSGFVQDARSEVRIEFQAGCMDPSDRELPANYDPNAACGSHDTCAALESEVTCRSACFAPEPVDDNESAPSSPIPCPIEDDIFIDGVEHGASYACVLSGAEPFCWGQLGSSETSPPLFRQPSRVMTPGGRATFRPGIDDVVDVAVASRVACMVFADGSLRCGGDHETLTSNAAPGGTRCCQTQPAGFPALIEVEVDEYICGLGEDSENEASQLYCSGLVPPQPMGADPIYPARRYERGTPPSAWTSLFGGPSLLVGLGVERLEVLTQPARFDLTGVSISQSDVAHVAANEHGLCVAMVRGGVRCWGEDEPVDLGQQWRRIAMSSHSETNAPEHRCAIREDGTLWCWGASDFGMLGIEPRGVVPFEERVQVGADSDWLDVSLGERVSCGVRSGGHLYCWGSNQNRELGRDSDDTFAPTRVPVPRW